MVIGLICMIFILVGAFHYCRLLFSKLWNDTCKNFLNIYRIEKAQEVLKNNPTIKIKVLSDMVGFNS